MKPAQINAATVAMVKSFEGLRDGDAATANIEPYLDPVDIWTIGWGHALCDQGRPLRGQAERARAYAVYPGGIDLAQAEALLRADLARAGREVRDCVRVDLNENEYGALTSFCFNMGAARLRGSTLLKKLNNGDRLGAADELLRWVRAGAEELPGLVKRRQAERALFLDSTGNGAKGSDGARRA